MSYFIGLEAYPSFLGLSSPLWYLLNWTFFFFFAKLWEGVSFQKLGSKLPLELNRKYLP